ncbi:MAG TPA: hypothetical protein VN736_01210 [Candidatus Limnocylindrales bacterium]|nr:hypothetical protein [Candidatus Limnocylindrales bacterium]
MYPLERNTKWTTRVLRFLNDQEQRFVQQTPKAEFVLKYTGVDQTSYNALYTFWLSMHGADINTFSLDLGTDPDTGVSMAYTNLVFVDDVFKAIQSKPKRWDITLRLRAVQ